jgi:hypothetical protein
MRGERINDASALEIIPDPLDQRCGWCGQASWLRRRAAAQTGYISFGNPNDQRPLIAGLYECSGCNKPSLAMFQAYVVSGWRTSLLRVIPAAEAVEMGLPHPEMEADRVEAWACFIQGYTELRSSWLVRHSNARSDPSIPSGASCTRSWTTSLRMESSRSSSALTWTKCGSPETTLLTRRSLVAWEDAEDSLTFLDDFLTTTIMTPERQRKRQQDG